MVISVKDASRFYIIIYQFFLILCTNTIFVFGALNTDGRVASAPDLGS